MLSRCKGITGDHLREARLSRMTHLRIWKFHPPDGREQEFSLAYGADGVWAALFGRARGYLGTELFSPDQPGGSWMTIDRWGSLANFEAFTKNFGDEYRALDA